MDRGNVPPAASPGLERARSSVEWGKGPPDPQVRRFLQGPQPRGFELGQAVRMFW